MAAHWTAPLKNPKKTLLVVGCDQFLSIAIGFDMAEIICIYALFNFYFISLD